MPSRGGYPPGGGTGPLPLQYAPDGRAATAPTAGFQGNTRMQSGPDSILNGRTGGRNTSAQNGQQQQQQQQQFHSYQIPQKSNATFTSSTSSSPSYSSASLSLPPSAMPLSAAAQYGMPESSADLVLNQPWWTIDTEHTRTYHKGTNEGGECVHRCSIRVHGSSFVHSPISPPPWKRYNALSLQAGPPWAGAVRKGKGLHGVGPKKRGKMHVTPSMVLASDGGTFGVGDIAKALPGPTSRLQVNRVFDCAYYVSMYSPFLHLVFPIISILLYSVLSYSILFFSILFYTNLLISPSLCLFCRLFLHITPQHNDSVCICMPSHRPRPCPLLPPPRLLLRRLRHHPASLTVAVQAEKETGAPAGTMLVQQVYIDICMYMHIST